MTSRFSLCARKFYKHTCTHKYWHDLRVRKTVKMQKNNSKAHYSYVTIISDSIAKRRNKKHYMPTGTWASLRATVSLGGKREKENEGLIMQHSKEHQNKHEEREKAEISLLLPVYNEVETIENTILEFYNEIGTKIPLEIIVAEDGSTDGTKEALRRLSNKIPMKLILGEQRKGYIGGVKDGLSQVTTDYVFFVDSDGQHVASDFWKLYKMKDSYDMIIGRKIKRNDPPHRILLSKVFHLMIRCIFRLPIRDPDHAYRLIKRSAINSIAEDVHLLPYSFWTEFTVRAFRKGFDIVELPVIHKRRLNGDTHLYELSKLSQIVISQLIGMSKLWNELKAT